jgi:Pre ATP-grasp domain/PGM1 C-terminal domain
MPKIIVINVGTDHVMGQDVTGSDWLTRSVRRNAWFADEGDVLVAPQAIPERLLRFAAEILGFDPASISVLVADGLVTDEALLSVGIVEALRSRVGDGTGWTISACFSTAGVSELAAVLCLRDYTGLPFAAQSGCALLNRKTHFRQLLAGAHVPLASGSVADTPAALGRAIERHLSETGTVIVKRDDGAGGMGNLTITAGKPAPLAGSRETRPVGADLRRTATEVWEELTSGSSEPLVVESYHLATQRFYMEYLVDEHGFARFSHSGTLRSRPDPDRDAKELVGVGLDIPARLPQLASATAISVSAQIAALAGRIGYRGILNVDGIVTDRGEVVFNEVNARWGGGTVLHDVAERLLDDRYVDHHTLSSVRSQRGVALAEVLRRLRQRELLYTDESQEGVLVLASDDKPMGTMECLLIAGSRARERELEVLMAETLEEARQAAVSAPLMRAGSR